MARTARMGRTQLLFILLTLLVFAGLIARDAWVSDDAFITLRTVHNTLNGYGMRWNVVERVQSYTHPAWMLLLLFTHGATGEPWYGTMLLGASISLLALGLLMARSPNLITALAAVLPLLGSKAFIDFSTSGLENPLTHLLLVLVAFSLVRGGSQPEDLARTTFVVGLALFNRLDAAVLFTPAWLVHAARVERNRRTVVLGVLALSPLLLWILFATVYYGSPLPNTAFAKLANGYPVHERVGQGLRYAEHLARFDPGSALLVLSVPLLALKHRSRASVAIGLGASAHLVYLIWAGGDFMAGRLFTPVVFSAAVLIALQERRPTTLGLSALVVGISLLSPGAPLRAGLSYHRLNAWKGIVDERGFYRDGASLYSLQQGKLHSYARAGQRLRAAGASTKKRAAVGLFGYYAGPKVHILDPLGLGDPLLARLPARYDPNWRVGHYRRAVPAGYAPPTRRQPDDPTVAALYDVVLAVTRGPLFEPSRWAAMLAFNTQRPSPWSVRFPGLKPGKAPQTVPPRGVVFKGALTELRAPAGHRWRVVFVLEDRIIEHDVDTGDGWTSLPAAPPSTIKTLLFPADRREARQVLSATRNTRVNPPPPAYFTP